MIAPHVEKLAVEYAGRLKVGKLNVDEHPDLAAKYQVSGIPSLLIFKDGKLLERIVGAQPFGALDSQVKSILSLV